MKKIKLKLWHKTLIALVAIGVITASTAGAMVAYAFNSDEVHGTLSPADHTLFLNDFSKIYDKDGKLNPINSIVDPSKTKRVANVLKDGKAFAWVGSNEEMSFDVFFKEYHKRYGESFVQEVKYGSFNFYNEYVLAVKPEKFIEFSKWFILNVAWGPDLLTLDSFRLVPGVQTQGNSIILGSHSTIKKEESEIKFFPDAFFGSMPLFSSAGGVGNAVDSLTDPTFIEMQDRKTTEKYFKSIPYLSAARNSAVAGLNAFKDIFLTYKLIDKTVLVSNEPFNNQERVILKDMTEEQFNSYVNANFPADNAEKSKLVYSNFTKYIVSGLQSKADPESGESNLEFSLSNQADETKKLSVELKASNVSSPSSILTTKSLKELSEQDFISFLDFYDLNSSLKKKFFLFEEANKKRQFFNSKIEAVNSIKNLSSEDDIKEWQVESFIVKDGKLHVALSGKNADGTSRTHEIVFESKDMDAEKLRDFLAFKNVLGYKGAIKPVTIASSPEDLTLKAPPGQTYTILDRVKYQVYNETYPNLLELVALKYPEVLKTSVGPHVVQVLNDKGYYDYKIENGEFKQYGVNDRIGLPLLLQATDDNYEGISIDFLKYVAAHEYGHHLTLEKTQALDEKNSGVIVNGLSSRAGVAITSYYNFNALENYLKARTNLEATRVNTIGKPSPTGSFVNFTFINSDGTKVPETYSDIWGAKQGDDDLNDVLSNPKRRFLQDFEGLKEAARLRKVRLGDLFIANAIDFNSGTLNPSIVGPNEVFDKEKDGKTVFKPVTRERLFNEFTDGAGNKLTVINQNGVPTIKVFEGTEKTDSSGNIISLNISKILIKNPDGSDVIKVPLNTDLSLADTQYVLQRQNEIRQNFNSLIITTLNDNGWNKADTVLGNKVSVSNREYFGGFRVPTPPKLYYNQILARGRQSELNPANNRVTLTSITDPARLDGRNLNIIENESLARQLFTLFASTISESAPANQTQLKWYNKDTILNFVTASTVNGNPTFKSKESYLISDNRAERPAPGQLPASLIQILALDQDDIGDQNASRVQTLNGVAANPQNAALNLPRTNGKIAIDMGTIFSVIFSQIGFLGRTDDSLSKLVVLLNDKNQQILANNGRNLAPFSLPIQPNLKSTKPEVFNVSRTATSENLVIGSVKKIAFDLAHPSLNNADFRFIDGAYNKKLLLEANGKKYLAFNSLQEFADFVSIDYSKATKSARKVIENGKETERVLFNWDLNYVKSKFDIEAFISKHPQEKDRSEQDIANRLMRIFSTSTFYIFTKNFPLSTDLLKNSAIFSKNFGIKLLDDRFSKNYTSRDVLTGDEHNIEDVLEAIKSWADGLNVADKKLLFEKLDLGDLLHFIGNRIWFEGPKPLEDAVIPIFTPRDRSLVSSDVRNYNASRTEDRLSEIFTDYVYSLAETLTRDYVQTTYVPISGKFSNLPSYIGNANEANTGIDYTIDAKILEGWRRNVITNNDVRALAVRYFNALDFNQMIAETEKLNKEYEPKISEVDKKLEALEKQKTDNAVTDEAYQQQKAQLDKQKADLIVERDKKIVEAKTKIGGDLINISKYNTGGTKNSSYFGRLLVKSNGYFKDRFQKKTIGMNLYDENLNEVIDKSIRLKDFDGKAIESAPKAFFISQLYNYGVSTRNLSGIFRNKTLDAVALYGYVKNEEADKIKKIRFINIKTGEAKYLKVNVNRTNNLFYLKKQGDPTSKVTLHDLGYSTWVSDYALMGKYRDTLLDPDAQYTIEFVDENNMVVKDITLGNLSSISENGKDPSQSPIIIRKQEVTDPVTKTKSERSVLIVDLQFNIQR